MPENNHSELESRDYVNSFARGLEVIRAFSRRTPRMTLSEVAQETEITRAAARRFLLTLVREGYAETDGKYFFLRPKVLELGFSVLSSMSIWEIAQPIMAKVTESLNESCSASVLDGEYAVYVARAMSKRVVNISPTIGGRLPAYCTSMGRVLLGGLSETELEDYLENVEPEKFTPKTVTDIRTLRKRVMEARRQGWALVADELELGLYSISVPLHSRSGKIAAALSVGCPSARTTTEEMRERFLPELQRAAQEITLTAPE